MLTLLYTSNDMTANNTNENVITELIFCMGQTMLLINNDDRFYRAMILWENILQNSFCHSHQVSRKGSVDMFSGSRKGSVASLCILFPEGEGWQEKYMRGLTVAGAT
jgi:hypothetical protein